MTGSAVPGSGPSQRRSRKAGGRETELKVRLSEDEKDRLRVKAAECGITMSRLMVEGALGNVRNLSERAALDAQLRDLRWLAGNVANNVNQLAHRANMAGQVRSIERLDQALEDISVLSERVEILIGRLG